MKKVPEKDVMVVNTIIGESGLDFREMLEVFEQHKRQDSAAMVSESPWMSRKEAAEYARCSIDLIDLWREQGYIEATKMGMGKRPGRVLVRRSSLDQFLRNGCRIRKVRTRKEAPSIPGGYRVQHKG